MIPVKDHAALRRLRIDPDAYAALYEGAVTVVRGELDLERAG